MTRANASSRAPDSAWGAETLRLTIFHPREVPFAPDGWWEAVTGQAPDSSVSKPKVGERAEVGKQDDYQLAFHVQQRLGRFDWVMQTVGGFETTPAPFPDRAQVFLNLMTKVLQRDDLPVVSRVALGAVLVLPVHNVEDGYTAISNYLNFDLNRATSSDFMYQINRKQPSMIQSGLVINRLMKWSVGKVMRQLLEVTQNDGLVATADPEDVSTACRLELDINTVPEPTLTIQKERLERLLMELFGHARSIIREGEGE